MAHLAVVLVAQPLAAATLQGRVTQCHGTAGAPGYVVVGFEHLRIGLREVRKPCTIGTQSPTSVGSATTGADGTFSIDYAPTERDPEYCFFEANVFVNVFAPGGSTPVHTSLELARDETTVFDDFDTGASASCPSALDLSFAGFGADGAVVSARPGGGARAMARQPDGKLVAVGDRGLGFFVARFLSNGSLDPTFGMDGVAAIQSQDFVTHATSVALERDGKLIVAGWAEMSPVENFMLARLTPTGALDGFFGLAGFVTTRFNADSRAFAVLVQPDDRIVAAGRGRFFGSIGSDYDFAVARYEPNGSLDPSFDDDGKAHVDFGDFGPSENEECNDIALQDDGKLVLVGGQTDVASDSAFKVARLNADGTPDRTFNSRVINGITVGGALIIDLGDLDPHAHAVAIQPDGKIVVAGNDTEAPEVGSHSSALVVRILSGGTLDGSFADGGKRAIGSLTGSILDVAIQPDGKIVLLGSHASPDNDAKLAFYRLDSNGDLDATFGGEGRLFVDVGGRDVGRAIAFEPDGRILACGESDGRAALVRLWPDGSPDRGGQQVLDFEDAFFDPNSGEVANALAIQADGSIVLAGAIAGESGSPRDFALARFLPDGRPDTDFGALGRVGFGFGSDEVATAVAIQSGGKIVAAGYSQPAGGDGNFMVARFDESGALDKSFNSLGFNILDFLGGTDSGLAMALAPDQKIVVAGTVFNGARSVFGVARFNADGRVDTTFDLDGKQLLELVPGAAHQPSAVVVGPDRKVVVAGVAGDDFALARFNEDGSVDDSFGTLGRAVTDMGGPAAILSLARAADGSLVAAGFRTAGGGNEFALARYTASGLLDPGFGAGGKVFTAMGSTAFASAVDVRGDGAIVAAGCAASRLALAQYLPSGALDPAFNGGTGIVIADLEGDSACATQVKFVAPNKIIAAGYQSMNGGYNMTVARFETSVEHTARKEFHRGDPNGDARTDISDAVAILNFLFVGGEAPACRESADAQNDGKIDISDAVSLLAFLFLGGPEPAAPGPAPSPCGVDPDAPGSAGDLGCIGYEGCASG